MGERVGNAFNGRLVSALIALFVRRTKEAPSRGTQERESEREGR